MYSFAAAACGGSALAAHSDDAHTVPSLNALPLGDGKILTSPRVGYVFCCQTSFGNNGAPPGKAPWITGAVWDQTAKPTVSGSIQWPNAQIAITRIGAERVVTANNLPVHTTGVFPIARSDPAYRYDGNPNPIAEQVILLRLSAVPAPSATPRCVPQGMIGFTLSGTALYNALDALGRDIAAHEVQDLCSGHPRGRGQYHYHSWSSCMEDAGDASTHSELVGYALDGYGVFGMRGVGGQPLINSDLDVCHGHTHSIPWDGQQVVLYHYHMTREYPYSVGCYHGVS